MIDIHTHILPGIDDGARILMEGVEIVRELAEQGVTDIIATPHYVNETIFMSPKEKNLELLERLRAKLVDEGIETKIYLGNEIYIDDKILDLIKAGKISTLADSRYLLVELPLDNEYQNYEDFLRELIENGYKVILAHPERYLIVQKNEEILGNLAEIGVLFQCNFGSLIGKYGKSAMKMVRKLAKEKMIFAFGSDAHHQGKNGYLGLAYKKLAKYYTKTELKEILVDNPGKILANF